jgi:hypothetical protein
MKQWLRDISRPRRFIFLALSLVVTVFRDEIRNHLEDAASAIAISWFKTNASTAMEITNFIGRYWWAIPWLLVPITIVVIVSLAFISSSPATHQLELIPRERLDDMEFRVRVKLWLEKHLSLNGLVNEAFLFGSILHDHYLTGDVDVVVVFQPARETQIGNAGRNLNEKTASDFQQIFKHPLHFQLFCADESTEKMQFLKEAGRYETLAIKQAPSGAFRRLFFAG